MKKTASTPMQVCPKEWARIQAAIFAAFDLAGLSRLYALRAVDAVASILYDCKRSARRGRKWVDAPCVERPAGWFQTIFQNKGGLAAKCKRTLESSGVLLADDSWAAPNLEHPQGTWANGYAVDYHPQGPESLTVWFPSAASLIESAVPRLRRIRGICLDPESRETLRLDKVGLLAAVRSGAVDVHDFAAAIGIIRRYDTLKKCGKIGDVRDKRQYTPLTMVSKSILPFFRSDSGPVREAFDMHTGAILSLAVAAGAEAKPETLPDGSLAWQTDTKTRELIDLLYFRRWMLSGGKWVRNPDADLYLLALKYIRDKEPRTNLFKGLTPKECRDRVKEHFMGALFASPVDVKRWRTLRRNAFAEARGKARRVPKKAMEEERKARIRLLIREWLAATFPDLFHFVETYPTEANETGKRRKKTPLFHAMTRGEKAIMGYLKGAFEKVHGGIYYRKHDALLTTAPATMDERETDLFVGSALMHVFGKSVGCAKDVGLCYGAKTMMEKFG